MSKTRKLRKPRVVIVGAGFGGLAAARELAGADVELTVLDRNNHHLFQPLLYQVATAGLSGADIAIPVRQLFKRQSRPKVVMANVTAVDRAQKKVQTSSGDFFYDYLILAPGSQYNYFAHPEWESLAPNLKTISNALKIRDRLLSAFESAENESDPDKRKQLLTFIIIGAGPTGVELAGALSEFVGTVVSRQYPHVAAEEVKILLLDGSPRILNAFPESLARKAQRDLEGMGVEVRVGVHVQNIDPSGVTANGEHIESATVLWAAGVKANPVASWLNLETEDKQKRVLVTSDLSIPEDPDVFIIGDSALFFGKDGKPLPGVAPVAMQQGRFAANAITQKISGNSEKLEFHYYDKGNLATIGRTKGIADFGKLRFSGFLAWALWLVVHIFYLVGFKNRVLVLFQWIWNYFTYQRSAQLIVNAEIKKEAQGIEPSLTRPLRKAG